MSCPAEEGAVMTLDTFAFVLAAALVVGGAVVVVLTKNVMRLAVGLGVFLLGVAGLFLYYGHAFLATAQVFVYVGGVLVLMLFAIMVVHRSDGKPVLEVRHDIGAAAIAIGVAAMFIMTLRDSVGGWLPQSGAAGASLATELLGKSVVVFELAGGLLLIGLVAVLVIVGSGDRR
jgi:NADH-quinone oxidoreductase subunit J